jgi:hypothetical protein
MISSTSCTTAPPIITAWHRVRTIEGPRTSGIPIQPTPRGVNRHTLSLADRGRCPRDAVPKPAPRTGSHSRATFILGHFARQRPHDETGLCELALHRVASVRVVRYAVAVSRNASCRG